MGPSSRRFIAGLVRIGLVLAAIAFVGRYVFGRVSHGRSIHVERDAVSDTLGPGDMRIYNSDSTVDLVLRGDRLLAGLSPVMVERIKGKIETEHAGDTSGLGGSISQLVRRSVAGAIGTHAAFPLADLRTLRYEDGQIVATWRDGRERGLFESVKTDHGPAGTFRAEEAQRFIQAVQARQQELTRQP